MSGRDGSRPFARETTPHPERPKLTPAELPIGGSTVDRLLAAGAGLCLAGMLIATLF